MTQNHGLTPLEKSNMAPQNESLYKRFFRGLFSRLKHRQKSLLIPFLILTKTVKKDLSHLHLKIVG